MATVANDSGASSALEKIHKLCTDSPTISSAYIADTSKSPGDLGKALFASSHVDGHSRTHPEATIPVTPERLEWARSCGKFGEQRPSDLFLAAYADILQCLENDPLANCCAPPLCGSTGYVPMTIIGPLHDQTRHMSNLIVRAQHEVLLATNFWKSSGASTFITDALRELSRRAGERNQRVVVKLMFDRGNPKQFFENHQNVSVKGMQDKEVGLPPPEDIPHLDFAVVNFHKPPLGTFHCKFMVVDRQIAVVSSNNIQDNDNLEMMSHLEGPIVDSLWETFLVSWHNNLDPALPRRDVPAASAPPPTYHEASFTQLFTSDGAFRLPEQPTQTKLPAHMPNDPHYDDTIAAEIERMRSVLQTHDGESYNSSVARHLNSPTNIDLRATAPEPQSDLRFFPFIPVAPSGPVPMAMASRKPYANLDTSNSHVPQNEAFLSLIRNAKRSIFIQTPDLNAKTLLPAIVAACRRGIEITYYVCLGYNDEGELMPGQNGTNEMAAHSLYKDLATEEERARLRVFFYVAADQTQPIHNHFKQRSCHIKLLIADDQVAVQGSGNQDTQSWYHSQEVNVMIDSPVVCKQWREGIERNQNTARYGRAREDGCWYDEDGVLAKDSYGTDPGKFSWAKGAMGMIKKAQGK